MTRSRRPAAIGILLTILGVTPLSAGKFYIPLASTYFVLEPALRFATHVTVLNTSGRERRLKVKVVEWYGTPQPVQSFLVAARSRFVFSHDSGGPGLLEISGARHFVVRARLDAIRADGNYSAELPLLHEGNILSAGDSAHLLDLNRFPPPDSTATVSDLNIVNFSPQTATCTVEARSHDREPIGGTATISVFAGSARRFEDVFFLLDEPFVIYGALTVSCDQRFYAFVHEWSRGLARSNFIAPASALEGAVLP